jgi:hypothetical protein
MTYGFQSKNSSGEYLITDQTTNLTFVKRCINYHAASQPFSGFGGSSVITYRVNDCSSTPIPYFTCPIAGKAYSVTQIKPTGTSNQWEIEMITNARSEEKPTFTAPANATVPAAGFSFNLDEELLDTVDNGYRNIPIKPASGPVSYAGRHRIVPQNYNSQSTGPNGLSRGGYLVISDSSSYKISTQTHVPYSMEYYPPDRRIRFSNILNDGEDLFHRAVTAVNNDGEGNGMGLFQYLGGDMNHYSVSQSSGTISGSEGSLRGAAHYRWWRKNSNSYTNWTTKAIGGNDPSEYISSTNRTRIYVTNWTFFKIRTGQHVNYCTAITLNDDDPINTFYETTFSDWQEIVDKGTYTFGGNSDPDDDDVGYWIEVAGNTPLFEDHSYTLQNEPAADILPGGKFWNSFHLHVRGFVDTSGNSANATFSLTNPTNSQETSWNNARLNADFTDSNIDFFPIQMHYQLSDRYYAGQLSSSTQEEHAFGGTVPTGLSYLTSSSASNTPTDPKVPKNYADTYNYKPNHANLPFAYSGPNQMQVIGTSLFLKQTAVILQDVPISSFNRNTYWAPNTIDMTVLLKGYKSEHKIYPDGLSSAPRKNTAFSDGIGPGLDGDYDGSNAPIQLASRTSNTISFNTACRLRRPIITAANFSHIVMASSTNYSNTGNIFAVYRGHQELAYTTSSTPGDNEFSVGTPFSFYGTFPTGNQYGSTLTPGTISAFTGTNYFQISNASNFSVPNGGTGYMRIRIPITYKKVDDAFEYDSNEINKYSTYEDTYVDYFIYEAPSDGKRVEIAYSQIIQAQRWTATSGGTSAPVAELVSGQSTLTVTANTVGVTESPLYYEFLGNGLGNPSITTSNSTTFTVPVDGIPRFYSISVSVRDGAADGDVICTQTRKFHVFADGTMDLKIVKFDRLTSFELATDTNAWQHDGLVTAPNDVQVVHRMYVPAVATFEGTIDNINGRNIEPFYVKSFCGFFTGDGSSHDANEVYHYTWETRHSAVFGNYNSHEHYNGIGYQAYTTRPGYGYFNTGSGGNQTTLGPLLASNYSVSSSSGVTRSSNDALQLGMQLIDDQGDDSASVKTFDEIAPFGGQTRGYVRAHYGFLDRANTYNEAIVWNGSIVATNSYVNGAFTTLANPVTVGDYEYTRDTQDATFSNDFLMFGVKRYGPYDPADFPSTADWDLTNIPELFIFSKPSAAPAGHGDYGLQVLASDSEVVFDSRNKPLLVKDTENITQPSNAVSSHDCSSLRGKSWGGRFQSHSGPFTPNTQSTINLTTGSNPAFFYNTKVQCHQECTREEKEVEKEAFGAVKRTYYHTTKYWALYKGGIVRENNNTSSIKAKYITVAKGAAYQYRKKKSYLFGAVSGGTRYGYNGIRPWNDETINNTADTVISIDTDVFRGQTYQIGGVLDSITSKIELTGSDRNGSFVDILNKSIEIHTGDKLELTVNIPNNNYKIAKDGTGTGSTYNPIPPEETFNTPASGAAPNTTIVWVAGSPGTYWYYSAASPTNNDLRGNITVTTS